MRRLLYVVACAGALALFAVHSVEADDNSTPDLEQQMDRDVQVQMAIRKWKALMLELPNGGMDEAQTVAKGMSNEQLTRCVQILDETIAIGGWPIQSRLVFNHIRRACANELKGT